MYALVRHSDHVLRLADNTYIPPDPRNVDYQAYQRWAVEGGVPEDAPPLPVPVPDSISDRQFFQQLAADGIITRAEALAAVKTGDIPAALAGIVDALPEADRFGAEMLLSGATVFERTHPLSVAIGEARGMTATDIDAFFRAAAAL